MHAVTLTADKKCITLQVVCPHYEYLVVEYVVKFLTTCKWC